MPEEEMSETTQDESLENYTIGDYLLDRLAELGLTELFGVPGDFNLHFLDHVVAHRSIRWVGSANELNAGYSADGYARIRGIGAFLTTYGVGELSAINAVAGSYAESVPVVQIVGAPPKETQASGRKIHHSLGDGDFKHFLRMAEEVTCAHADLDAPTATWEIDRVLRDVVFRRRPGYLMLAADVAEIAAYPPSEPLTTDLPVTTPRAVGAFEAAVRRFLPGRRTAVLADLLVHRLGATEELASFLTDSQLPFATLAWGKTLVDESDPNFVGIYAGAASQDRVREVIEGADALITLGVEYTDNTTAGFSMDLDSARMIDVSRFGARVGHEVFTPISLQDALAVLHRVTTELDDVAPMPAAEAPAAETPREPSEGPLTQDGLWAVLASQLESANIVAADQGTSYFGMASHRFPAKSTFIGQPMWGSIGYTLPAIIGAGLADPSRRPVLLIGDGSAQLTIQEMGVMIREKLPVVVVLVNNAGYTVERAIHGPDEVYNDIAPWRWELVPRLFGAAEEDYLYRRVTTEAELLAACRDTMSNREKLVFIEAITDRDDIPQLLQDVADALKR
ncbi:thiamine pyrophosphate-dependent enzyme [Nesterenkonia sp. AY15]|uniref:alpha-keto acid decarboxylase family protein n=1 Tax=Nesterenkonia sp. AY15 TaxID=2901139 RepID=UPI001F4D0821|nr:thiamine pyrophosphate-binding protein [Nesterenkonia sp. AY15]MCH8570550.1 thiamine pyrophosphate-dependent enzyme [Nesterenkonia sp. AY15]